jgi:tripartite-type tricarboxylate transporter receptor subunit TctC
MMHRREIMLAGASALAAAGGLGPAAAQAWPGRPVTVVHPFAPGGQSEAVGRVVAQHLHAAFGQPFVWENRSGAGGTVGAAVVARAAPDGQTLLFATTGVFVIAPYVFRNAGYDAAGFTPVGLVTEVPVVFAASRRSGFATAADVVAAARARPGAVSYGSGGVGSFPHLMGELFASLTGVQMTHVPYRGGAPALSDLAAGQVDLLFDGVSTVAPQVEAGRATALLTTGPGRHPLLPAVPNAAEAGMPDLNLTSWNGFVAPPGTPAGIVAALNREINVALATPQAKELIARLGVGAIGGGSDVMAARIARESEIYRRIIAAAGVSAD